MDKHISDLYDESIHAAVAALYRALGTPEEARVHVPPQESQDAPVTEAIFEPEWGFHPVFGLAAHYRGHDNTVRPAYPWSSVRGDVMVIPGYGEDGRIYAVEIAFHKGRTTVRNLRFPDTDAAVHATLLELLEKFETR